MTRGLTDRRVQSADFRRAMGRFGSGVTIVTVYDDDGRACGMTLTAFCSLSVDPPQVLLCVNKDTRTHELIVRRETFGVSILSSSGAVVSDYCARPGADKFLKDDWIADSWETATPALRQSLAHLDCELVEHQAAGSHTVFIAQVNDLTFGAADEPLIYFQGGYRGLEV